MPGLDRIDAEVIQGLAKDLVIVELGRHEAK
jgi:hypothetical protein